MIAYRPVKPGKRGSNIPNDVIDRAMGRHPDGFGLAWRDTDETGKPRLNVAKFGPDERSAFRAELKRIDSQSLEYVAHFRWATQGPRVQHLAHPYEYEDAIEGRVLVFHNGIIDINAADHESDTEVFVRDVLARLPSGWWRTPALRFLVNSAISWSKLVLMTAAETVNLHESRGDWDGGLWYSSEHKAYKSYSSSGHTSSSEDDWGHWDKDKQAWVYPAAKSAATSAATMGLLTEGDPDDDAILPVVRRWAQPMNAGHRITEMVAMPRDRDCDYPLLVTCDECHTVGDAYVIEGQIWYDIPHRSEDDSEDEAEAARVAERLSALDR